jgi:hypothetical protein
MSTPHTAFIAFEGPRRIARGPLSEVALTAQEHARQSQQSILIFDATSSSRVELDLRGTADELRARLDRLDSDAAGEQAQSALTARRGPGRPRLGVVPREVTLLPRHWAWLSAQPGGASATLRKLVEQARRDGGGRQRQAQDATYRFATALAGDEPGYEEAIRALYRSDAAAFERCTAGWPADVREHSRELARSALSAELRSPPDGRSTDP